MLLSLLLSKLEINRFVNCLLFLLKFWHTDCFLNDFFLFQIFKFGSPCVGEKTDKIIAKSVKIIQKIGKFIGLENIAVCVVVVPPQGSFTKKL